ncbi:Hybrid non-ribosomal peptide synthetase/type I polyketide synthase OS=Lysinibacillus sphaericus OX=1421 GN=LS41612_16930 PE=3 SV=1 [Lysinibacillus sphaericus]
MAASETTIWSTTKDLTHSDYISIGKPIANTQIFILNEEQQLQPYGVYGEICIAGEGLARGYYNDKLETDKKFTLVEDLPGIKVYKTGDRGRMHANGEIEISGRLDNQIKIRGYRIELGEIEKAALEHSNVNIVVVKANEDADYNKNLTLYYCLKDDAPSAARKDSLWLKNWLQSKLPNYMVPTEYMQLDNMPVLPNGKINKNALATLEEKTWKVVLSMSAVTMGKGNETLY